ncbi:MAG: SLC13 family permease [Candidatus Kapaibacterium sp.]
MTKILIVDDEKQFRESMSERLKMRGYDNMTLEDGRETLKLIRSEPDIDIVILDRKMPGISGEEVLKEIKSYRPELQVIMLTGYGDTQSAIEAGKLDAYSYLQKPVEMEVLLETIENAREHKTIDMQKHEIPDIKKGTLWQWLKGTQNSRPGILILGIVLFFAVVMSPPPARLVEMLGQPKTGELTDPGQGYASYKKMEKGENIANYYGTYYGIGEYEATEDGFRKFTPVNAVEAAEKAQVMIGVLIVAALFWATGAVPIGITALLVGVFMYFLGVLKPDDIAMSYLKDSVIFIFGVLAFSTAISKTGLDRRIGILLLGSSKSVKSFLFLFLPMFAVACSFLSAHALIAFIMPILLIIYLNTIKNAGIKEDFAFAVILFLSVNFASNSGGPGSPVAGGRNAIMLGILSDYGVAPTFGEWVLYGMPFVPVMAIVTGLYFYLVLYRKMKIKQAHVSQIVKKAAEKIGPMTKDEYLTGVILGILIVLWITTSDILGLGGPILLALVLLNVFRILSWKNIASIQWEVVALYAAATAMGKGLAVTGGALYIADLFVSNIPSFLQSGEGLAIATSLFTGIVTNFMSDGAAVSTIGPITVPMAKLADVHPWMVGFVTAFASSFAHMFVIGTPNNAIVFTMARNPTTGAQLVKLSDFFKHGAAVFVLSMIVLWFVIILGYWRWLGF